LEQLQHDSTPTLLLVTPGRAANAVRATQAKTQASAQPLDSVLSSALRVHYLPSLTQLEYDHLLWACDFNCVRGEDSLVRALWAQKPFVWHTYRQDDGAHHAKLHAFLDRINADPTLRQFHWAWNAESMAPNSPHLPALKLSTWNETLSTIQQQLRGMDDLCTQLIRFVQKTR
jgi:uncharacterized repeat protein (TIGR03837 family)